MATRQEIAAGNANGRLAVRSATNLGQMMQGERMQP